ncbi:MAG: hypothetical protein IKH27_11025 [Oscillospiraceae bacterium]|nr:hypothetical protein [Oscillospiraceae bacterium]MBR3448328.1 hypothetical protein [Oscillospiraceae bacterium]
MIFRDFVEALCDVSNEEITVAAALTLLKEAIGEDAVQTLFPNKKVEANMKAYIRSERNLKKSLAKDILEAFNTTKENQNNLKEYLCEQCFCNNERIARTKAAFGKYCTELQNMEGTKILKKKGVTLLLALFTTMLKEAGDGYRNQRNGHSRQSEAEQNASSVSLQQTANSTTIVDAQNKSDIALSYTITDDEKRAVMNICEIIKRSLESIKQKTEVIDRKQHELASISEDTSQQRWKEYLEYELKALHKAVKELYSKLDKYCADLTELLLNKQHLHPSFKAIYEIASQIGDEKLKSTCPATFSYSALALVITNFQKNYERLKKDIANL